MTAIAQRQSSRRSPLPTLFMKDLRLARAVLLPAVAILAVAGLFLAAAPMLGDDVMRLLGIRMSASIAERLVLLTPIYALAAFLVPAWVAVCLALGDSDHGAAMLAVSLPVTNSQIWKSKVAVSLFVVGAILVGACLLISEVLAQEVIGPLDLRSGMNPLRTLQTGAASSAVAGLLGVAWGFGAAAFARSRAGASALAVALPVLAASLAFLVAIEASALASAAACWQMNLDPRFPAVDQRPDELLAGIAREGILARVGFAVAIAGLFCAISARRRIIGQGDPTRRLVRTGAIAVGICVACSAIGESVAVVVETRSERWNTSTSWVRQYEAEFRAAAQLPTSVLLERAFPWRVSPDGKERALCARAAHLGTGVMQETPPMMRYFVELAGRDRRGESVRLVSPRSRSTHPFRLAIAYRFVDDPRGLVEGLRALANDETLFYPDRFAAMSILKPLPYAEFVLRRLMDARTPCERAYATLMLAETVYHWGPDDVFNPRSPGGAFSSGNEYRPGWCKVRVLAIGAIGLLRQHLRGTVPLPVGIGADAPVAIDAAMLDACAVILDEPMSEFAAVLKEIYASDASLPPTLDLPGVCAAELECLELRGSQVTDSAATSALSRAVPMR